MNVRPKSSWGEWGGPIQKASTLSASQPPQLQHKEGACDREMVVRRVGEPQSERQETWVPAGSNFIPSGSTPAPSQPDLRLLGYPEHRVNLICVGFPLL